MKILIYTLIIFGLLHNQKIIAQAKYDYNWILGFPENDPDENFGGVWINFNNDGFKSDYFYTNCPAQQPTAISNKDGRLLAYSNGCSVFNAQHNLMQNGDTISYGYIWDIYCNVGYPGTQHLLFLPWPGDTTRAVLFYFHIDDFLESHYLMYSTVKFTKDNPLGTVIEKDKLLLDPGTSALITAVKHANGRDWWILIPEDNSNRFFKILLTIAGVELIDVQSIGEAWGPQEYASQAVFSPDGQKYIRFNPWKGLDIFDFNRCNGELSNPLESGPFTNPVMVGGGVAVSQDSRFLYVTNILDLFQYDLKAPDILSSKSLVDTYDGFLDPFPTNFYHMSLAPDGKIYIFSTNGKKSLHVINSPNRLGDLCNFQQHSIDLPAYIRLGGINMPYYRLGPLDESECDTLNINNIPVAYFIYEYDTLNPFKVYFTNLSYFEPESFSWSFGSGLFSTSNQPDTITYNLDGTYEVCLNVANEYGEDTYCQKVIIPHIPTNIVPIDRQKFVIYPNPTHSEFIVSLDEADHSNYIFTLFTTLGKKVYQTKFNSTLNTLSIDNFNYGIYFYTISIENTILQCGKLSKI